jgi:hypothetical protein
LCRSVLPARRPVLIKRARAHTSPFQIRWLFLDPVRESLLADFSGRVDDERHELAQIDDPGPLPSRKPMGISGFSSQFGLAVC